MNAYSLRYLRSPASGAVCRRRAARTGIGGGFRLYDRFRTPAADPLTRAASRARPDTGREVCTNPSIKRRSGYCRSVSRALSACVNPPHIFIQYCLERAGDHWSPAVKRTPKALFSSSARFFAKTYCKSDGNVI